MAIDLISTTLPAAKPAEPIAPGAGSKPEPLSFVDSLGRLVASAEAAGAEANAAVAGMLDGTTDVHEAMIGLQRAEMALQLTVQVRNKLVQAYQEIMRMPV